MRPTVVAWYKAYCWTMVAIYLIIFAGSVLTLALADFSTMRGDPEGAKIQLVVLAVMGLPLAILFAVGPFLPRSTGGWIYGIVLIALGLTSCLCWPATIPLLIYWIKPETKQYFSSRA